MTEYAIVGTPVAALYADAESFALADEALCGFVCRVTERGSVRSKVRTHYGYEGYAENDALVFASEESVRSWLDSGLKTVDYPFLDVLAAPDIRAERMTCLPRGAVVSAVAGEVREGWRRIRLSDHREGFVPDACLAEKRFADRWEGFSFPTFLKRWYDGSEDTFRRKLITVSMRFLGTQYRWGGRSVSGLDCSGLASLTYMLAGVNIFRDAKPAPGYPIRPLSMGERLRTGDLLYFPGHVAMYLGDGRYIHATARAGSNGVVINSLDQKHERFRPDLYESLYAIGGLR